MLTRSLGGYFGLERLSNSGAVRLWMSCWEMKCICIVNFWEPGLEIYDLSFSCFSHRLMCQEYYPQAVMLFFRGAGDLGGKVYLKEMGTQDMFLGARSNAYFVPRALSVFSLP